ncbi:MAG: AAA family ATPase [Planctomycetaceae bacterium]|nr:AAA family ATPase [Planctomycetaceae bacterium]
MYQQRFGLHRKPFQNSLTENDFFETAAHREIFAAVLHALKSDLGVAVLTGPAGSGKTTVLEQLRRRLSVEGQAVLLRGGAVRTASEFLSAMQRWAAKTGSPNTVSRQSAGDGDSRWAVTERLRQLSDFWGPVAILLDDAHLIQPDVFLELRGLLEEENDGQRIMRLLIAGPLSLEETLAQPAMTDFVGRIRTHVFLQPLRSNESVDYLKHQLAAVGGSLADLFDSSAVEHLVAAADGVPRCINLLGDECLLVCDELNRTKVSRDIVNVALQRLQHLPYAWNASPDLHDSHDESSADFSDDASVVLEPDSASESERKNAYASMEDGVIEIGSPSRDELKGSAPFNSTGGETRSVFEIGADVEMKSDGVAAAESGEHSAEIEAIAESEVMAELENQNTVEAEDSLRSLELSERERVLQELTDESMTDEELQQLTAHPPIAGLSTVASAFRKGRLQTANDVDYAFDQLERHLILAGTASGPDSPDVNDSGSQERPEVSVSPQADSVRSQADSAENMNSVESAGSAFLLTETETSEAIAFASIRVTEGSASVKSTVSSGTGDDNEWREAGAEWIAGRVENADEVVSVPQLDNLPLWVPAGTWSTEFSVAAVVDQVMEMMEPLATSATSVAEPVVKSCAGGCGSRCSDTANRPRANAKPVFDRYTWNELGRPVTPEHIQRRRGPDRLAMKATWPPQLTGICPVDEITVTDTSSVAVACSGVDGIANVFGPDSSVRFDSRSALRPDRTIERIQSLLDEEPDGLPRGCVPLDDSREEPTLAAVDPFDGVNDGDDRAETNVALESVIPEDEFLPDVSDVDSSLLSDSPSTADAMQETTAGDEDVDSQTADYGVRASRWVGGSLLTSGQSQSIRECIEPTESLPDSDAEVTTTDSDDTKLETESQPSDVGTSDAQSSGIRMFTLPVEIDRLDVDVRMTTGIDDGQESSSPAASPETECQPPVDVPAAELPELDEFGEQQTTETIYRPRLLEQARSRVATSAGVPLKSAAGAERMTSAASRTWNDGHSTCECDDEEAVAQTPDVDAKNRRRVSFSNLFTRLRSGKRD